jgi:hypothetical protein
MSTIPKTMKLITAAWQGKKSFRLMPVLNDCPFKEGIFDVDSKILVMISKDSKQTFHMLPKLDANGDPEKVKGIRVSGKTVKEERRAVETSTEHYITEKEEIEETITDHAFNAESFPWETFLVKLEAVVPERKVVELGE